MLFNHPSLLASGNASFYFSLLLLPLVYIYIYYDCCIAVKGIKNVTIPASTSSVKLGVCNGLFT